MDSQAFEQGNKLAKDGDLRRAEEAYARADEEGHGAAAAYAGLFAESRGELDEAEAAYRRADERGDGFGAFRLGLLLSRAGKWDEAADAWARANERGQERPPFDHMAMLGAAPVEDSRVAPEVQRSAFANPVLLGAVTVLVLIVAVFLSYNANTGLPFVPTRELKVQLANGSNIVDGNQVTSAGGYRIGVVSDMHPVRLPTGVIGAELDLKLSRSFGSVPVDSTVTIRPRSLLGLKYVDLERGTSSRVIPDGGVLPQSQTSIPVQFDDINKMFDAKTRPAVQQNLVGFGDTLAFRGSSLNDTFAALPSLLAHLTPVARYLSDPSTELTRLFSSLNSFFSTVSPVAAVNLRLFADQATTFEGISRDPAALEDTIRQSPPTLDVGTDSLAAQQPFLVDLQTFSNDLNPASAALRAALPNINPALEAGIQVLPRTEQINAKLERVLSALKDLAQAPGTNMAVNALTATVTTLNPMIRYLGPFITVCNTWNYFWTDFGDHLSETTNQGFAQRVLLNTRQPPDQQLRFAGGDGLGQRLPAEQSRGPARVPAEHGGRRRVCPRPDLPWRDQQQRHRRLRGRPARVSADAELVRSSAPAPGQRGSHPRKPGHELDWQPARSPRRDLQPQPPDRAPGAERPLQPLMAETFRLGGDLEVRRMGFGAMRITGEGIWGEPEDPGGAKELLRRVADAGVNLIDTADAYGPEVSENLIAEALHPYPEGMVIATKGGLERPGPGSWKPSCRPDRLKRCCEDSLRRLRLERIDLYQLHTVDPDVPIEDSIGALAELRDEGKVRHIGVCNVGRQDLQRAQQIAPIVSVQNRYNVGDRQSERVLEACQEMDLAFLPWFPLATGELAKPGGQLDEVAEAHSATTAQVALAWLLQHSPVTLPIPGTSSVAHFEENFEATGLELSDDEVAQLDELAAA